MVKVSTSIVDQRTILYTSYMLMLEDPDKYTVFKSRHIADVIDVDIVHTSALIMKCILAGLIRRAGKDGRAGLYELTSKGLSRAEYYFEHWNQITNEFY